MDSGRSTNGSVEYMTRSQNCTHSSVAAFAQVLGLDDSNVIKAVFEVNADRVTSGEGRLIDGFQRYGQFVFIWLARLLVVFYGAIEGGVLVLDRRWCIFRLRILFFAVFAFGLSGLGRYRAARFQQIFRNEDGIAHMDAPGIEIRIGFHQARPIIAGAGIPLSDGIERFAMMPDFVGPKLYLGRFLVVLP
jgi:ABC-type branched-subunit amino acid transport system permease subunit